MMLATERVIHEPSSMSAEKLRRQRLEGVKRSLIEAGAPPDLDVVLKPLLRKARQVHAAYICDNRYGVCEVWYKLMLMLGATESNVTNIKADWQAFANLLGYDRDTIRSIQNVFKGVEDPVTITLIAFMQKSDASLDKIIEALQAMKREDILEQISGPLSDLCEKVIQENTDQTMVSSDSGFSEAENSVVIKPRFVLPVPCLLRSKEELNFSLIYSTFKSQQQVLSTCAKQVEADRDVREHSVMVAAADEGYGNDAAPPPLPQGGEQLGAGQRSANFDTTVLLTFVEDGREAAYEVARALRATTNSQGQHVGVVILEENESIVNVDQDAFVRGVFEQVDYVVPILSADYAATVKPNSLLDVSGSLDAQYARYIYKLIQNYYVEMGCMNKKIRSIVPTGTDNSTITYLTSDPVFKARKLMRDCEKFADLICRRKS
ncbi:uncharacterized protein LOC135948357 isoform X1 [Cloeon dipterum]|uniref:uncharacterized protein LOC135948357 isoform X1 n=1 Tax=Cloeon dipterum TaxID=197152 RepID=UPI0032204E71